MWSTLGLMRSGHGRSGMIGLRQIPHCQPSRSPISALMTGSPVLPPRFRARRRIFRSRALSLYGRFRWRWPRGRRSLHCLEQYFDATLRGVKDPPHDSQDLSASSASRAFPRATSLQRFEQTFALYCIPPISSPQARHDRVRARSHVGCRIFHRRHASLHHLRALLPGEVTNCSLHARHDVTPISRKCRSPEPGDSGLHTPTN